MEKKPKKPLSDERKAQLRLQLENARKARKEKKEAKKKEQETIKKHTEKVNLDMATEISNLRKKLESYQLKEKPTKRETSKDLKKALEPVKEELANPFDDFKEEPKKEPPKKEEVKPKKKVYYNSRKN